MPESTINKLFNDIPSRLSTETAKQRDTVYKREMAAHADKSRAEQMACGLAAFLREKDVTVCPNDILAGNPQYVDHRATNPIKSNEIDPAVKPQNSFDIPREIEGCRAYYGDKLSKTQYGELDIFLRGTDSALYKRWASGHVIAGYAQVVRDGYGALEEKILQQLPGKTGDEQAYLNALLTTVRVAQEYVGRYAAAARLAAEGAAEPESKARLTRIADACEHLQKGPATNFFEAVQGLILLHEMLIFENYSGSMSLGRLDQIFGPYYEEDVQKGVLTFDEARTIIDALWVKFAMMVQSYQNVTLGGYTKDGESACNDVTLMCLRASYDIGADQPLMSLRCNGRMEDRYWEEAQRLIARGGGFPALFNDDIIMEAKERIGVSGDDSWDYGIVGCVEPSICGKEYANTEELRINWAKVLELMLHGGRSGSGGERFRLHTQHDLGDITTFEEFYSWYKSELLAAAQLAMRATNILDSAYPHFYPAPLLSLTMEGCIENAQDTAAQGTVYNFSTANSCGMADTVDSLLAIKEMVFDKRMLSLPELADILDDNFAGHEDTLAYAREQCEKFGNDTQAANSMMADLVDAVSQEIDRTENCRGSRFQAGMYTVEDQAAMGSLTGALPSGRQSGVALANAICPSQGADYEGPTAVMNSVLSFDHGQCGNGLVLDLKFNPSFFREEGSARLFRPLVQAYFQRNGMEAQFNVVDKQTLLEAQAHPEKHKNLLVRVSGFSAYFVTLGKVLQDEIIQRTEYDSAM